MINRVRHSLTKLLRALFWPPLLAASLISTPAPANDGFDSLIGTTFVKFSEQRRAGESRGCELEYKAIFRDYGYEQGSPYVLGGAISVTFNSNNDPLIGLKVGTHRITSQNGKITLIPERPNYSYLANSSGEHNAEEIIDQIDSDTEGYRFYIFNFATKKSLKMMASIAQYKAIKIVFNRKKGGMDVEVPLDLTVISTNERGGRTHDGREVLAFDACVMRMIDKTLEKLGSKKG